MGADASRIPYRSPKVYDWFRWYVGRYYLAKQFHAFRESLTSSPIPAEVLRDGGPLILVVNHPSWWDLVACIDLTHDFPNHRPFVPIDQQMLNEYGILKWMGAFGVEQTPKGAIEFLRTCDAIFSQPFAALWITAQGEFVDVRKRPVTLKPGVGMLAQRLKRGHVIPVALEYPFWTERTPELLFQYGEAIPIAEHARLDRAAWTAKIALALEQTQDRLAEVAVSREPERFRKRSTGKVGVGGMYDRWRRFKAWIRGKRFRPEHLKEAGR